MLTHFLYHTLDEELVWIAVVLILHIEVGLRLEFLADALSVGDDVVDAQLEVGKIEWLCDVSVCSCTVGLVLVLILGLGGQHHNW